MLLNKCKNIKNKSWPKNLKAGKINLEGTDITYLLRRTTTCSTSLDLSKTDFFPEDLRYINGNLNLESSTIKTLPNNLTVNGDLDLRYFTIKTLPDDLIVKGKIYIESYKIDDIYIPTHLKDKIV